ncbi:MAG: hypothetical protein WAV90_22995 [Gordonia amarae]
MNGLRPLAAVLVIAAGFLAGCSTAIDGTPTAPPSVDSGPTRVRLVLPDPPPPTPPAVVRELPEIVTPTGATR